MRSTVFCRLANCPHGLATTLPRWCWLRRRSPINTSTFLRWPSAGQAYEQRNATVGTEDSAPAVMDAIKLETALRRFTEDGRLQIDNNRCERALRGVALGRKNWLFAGSEYGGQAAATFFSIIGSARMHEIEPWVDGYL